MAWQDRPRVLGSPIETWVKYQFGRMGESECLREVERKNQSHPHEAESCLPGTCERELTGNRVFTDLAKVTGGPAAVGWALGQ